MLANEKKSALRSDPVTRRILVSRRQVFIRTDPILRTMISKDRERYVVISKFYFLFQDIAVNENGSYVEIRIDR